MSINRNRLVGNFPTLQNSTKSTSRDYLIKQLPSATAFVNTEFEVVHASDSWVDSFGFSTTEVFGATLFDLFGEVAEQWRPVLSNCFRGLSSGLNVDSYRNENGGEVHIQWKNLPWYDENENIVGAIIQKEDVSHLYRNKQELERLEAVILEKSETAKIGSWEMALNGDIWWCPMTKKIHEVSDDYAPSYESVIEFFKAGPSRQKILNAIELAREKDKPWSEKLQIITPSGKEKWVICSGKPLYREGKYASLIGTFQDIDARVLQDTKTEENERLLQTLIDNLPLNVFIKDTDSRKILVNKAECQYSGVQDPEELLGKSDFDLYDKDIAQISRDEDVYVMQSLKPILSRETYNRQKDGTITTFMTSKIPLIGEEGVAIGLIGISLDISDIKTKEEELRKLINVTSLQNKKLVDFAHIISHNLRSYAANFSMLLEFLLTEKNEGERKNITGMLVEASEGLLETLDNLNEVVAINANTNLDRKPVFLKKAVHNVAKDLTNLLLKNRAVVINDIPDKLKVNVVPDYLESILMNFITNGVKYRDPSRDPIIKLKTEIENNLLVLIIEDNGVGIDLKEHGGKLFGMYKTFHQNEDARGIGLYITKNQIEAMNGKVAVQSEVGRGTTFKIYFNGKN